MWLFYMWHTHTRTHARMHAKHLVTQQLSALKLDPRTLDSFVTH